MSTVSEPRGSAPAVLAPRVPGSCSSYTAPNQVLFPALVRDPQLATPSLGHNFVWTLGANGLYAACQWGVLVSVARLTTPEQTGDLIFGLSVTAPVMLLAGLQLRLAHAADAGRKNTARHYLNLRLRTTLAALLVVIVIALFLAHSVNQTAILLLVAGNKGVEAIIDQCYGAFQQRQRMDIVAKSMIGRGMASLVLSVSVLLLTRTAWSSVLCMLFVSGAFLFARDLKLCRTLDRSLRAGAVAPRNASSEAALARQTLPLGAVSMLYSLNTNAPRIIVQNALGSSALGVYGSINYLHTLGHTVAGALADSALPKMAKALYHDDRRSFWRTFRNISTVIFAVCAAGIALAFTLGSQLLTMFFGPAYSEYSVLLRWQAVNSSLILLTVPMSYAMVAARAYKAQLWIVAATVAITLFLSSVLVVRYGVLGAAWASFWGALVHLVLFAAAVVYSVRRYCPEGSNPQL
jgi:O-antigen/teichoic acid export membrane protein